MVIYFISYVITIYLRQLGFSINLNPILCFWHLSSFLPRPVEGELVDAGPYSDPPPPRDPRDLVAVVESDLVELPALSPVPAGLVPSVVDLNAEEMMT